MPSLAFTSDLPRIDEEVSDSSTSDTEADEENADNLSENNSDRDVEVAIRPHL